MASSVVGGTGDGSSGVLRMDLAGNKLPTIPMLARYLFGARRPLARTWSGSNVRGRGSKNRSYKAPICFFGGAFGLPWTGLELQRFVWPVPGFVRRQIHERRYTAT